MLSMVTVLVEMKGGLYGHAPIGTLISFRFTHAIVADREKLPPETGRKRGCPRGVSGWFNATRLVRI